MSWGLKWMHGKIIETADAAHFDLIGCRREDRLGIRVFLLCCCSPLS